MNKLYYRITNGTHTYETADYRSIPFGYQIIDTFFIPIDERSNTVREAMQARVKKIKQKRYESRT